MIKKLLHQNENADGGSTLKKKRKKKSHKTRLNIVCFKVIKKGEVIYFDDRNDNLQWFVQQLIFI